VFELNYVCTSLSHDLIQPTTTISQIHDRRSQMFGFLRDFLKCVLKSLKNE
jgi:hypothetical protein